MYFINAHHYQALINSPKTLGFAIRRVCPEFQISNHDFAPPSKQNWHHVQRLINTIKVRKPVTEVGPLIIFGLLPPTWSKQHGFLYISKLHPRHTLQIFCLFIQAKEKDGWCRFVCVDLVVQSKIRIHLNPGLSTICPILKDIRSFGFVQRNECINITNRSCRDVIVVVCKHNSMATMFVFSSSSISSCLFGSFRNSKLFRNIEMFMCLHSLYAVFPTTFKARGENIHFLLWLNVMPKNVGLFVRNHIEFLLRFTVSASKILADFIILRTL